MKLISKIAGLCLFFFAATSYAETYTYSGDGDETWEQKSLKPGDVVIIKNGVYTDLKINVHGIGTQEAPIRVMAETLGGVVLKGESWLRYWGRFMVIEGFDFTEVKHSMYKNKPRPPIANRRAASSSSTSKDMCVACILQHIRIDNEHEDSVDDDYKWVELYGYYNTVQYNYFGAKRSKSRVLQVQLSHSEAEKQPVHHRIRYNYFASRNTGEALDNGGEAILIGESKRQHVVAKAKVEHNLFFDASIEGEPEVISNKSTGNLYQYNTIRETSASLTLRHGNKNTVTNNWFFQNQRKGSGGIRVIGKDNVISNNYIDGAAGPGHYFTALGMAAGYSEKDDKANINGYQLSERNVFDNNSVLNSPQPVMLSTWYKRDQNMTRPPKKTTFTDNLVFQMGHIPSDNAYVAGEAISVTFTPEAENYNNKKELDKAEYVPSFAKLSGNISDYKVSKLVAKGTKANVKATLNGCDSFGTGDKIYEQYKGAGADISKMQAPLVWKKDIKSARLGPVWLNDNWGDEIKTYKPCNS